MAEQATLKVEPYRELPEVFTIVNPNAGYNGDIANLRGQSVSRGDGLLSVHDAQACGVKIEDWKALWQGLSGDALNQRVAQLFSRCAPKIELKKLRLSNPERTIVTQVSTQRAAELQKILAQLQEIRHAGGNTDAEMSKLQIEPPINEAERTWLNSELQSKTERVVFYDGKAHYMTPEMRATIIDRRKELYKNIEAARAKRQLVVFLSTPISSGERKKINVPMARFIAEQIAKKREGIFEKGTFVINPAEKDIPGANGDDYRYLYEPLLFNAVDVVHFTSQDDINDYFKSIGKLIPSDYDHNYGDALWHSNGCRIEWNTLVHRNKQKNGTPVMAYHGHSLLVPTAIMPLQLDTYE